MCVYMLLCERYTPNCLIVSSIKKNAVNDSITYSVLLKDLIQVINSLVAVYLSIK